MRDVAVVAGDQRGDEQPTPLTQRPRGGRSIVRRPAANSAHEDPPVPTPWLICIKAVNGGLFVALFAVIGEMRMTPSFASTLTLTWVRLRLATVRLPMANAPCICSFLKASPGSLAEFACGDACPAGTGTCFAPA